MEEKEISHQSKVTNDKKEPKTPYKKYAVTAFFALLIFASGWSFGRGRVTLANLREGTVNNSALDFRSVDEVHAALQKYYDGTLDANKALDGLKSGLASATDDPYTEYFNNEESKAFEEELSGSFEGIGAELGKTDGNIAIIAPIAGSPAEKAGVRPGDIIVYINDTLASDLTITEAVKLIRGKAGTDVKLTLSRDGQKVEVTITRATIDIPSVTWEIKEGNIGLLKISRFSDDTVALAKQAANEFKEKSVKGIVLDLRSNPGGLLDAAVQLSSLWLKKNETVLVEKRGGKIEKTYKADGNNILSGIKTVVLINGGSASASEITAGALHDNGVATLLGEKSYGKGSVQQILTLDGGGSLKVTIARWFTPKDKNIDKEGITPEKEVKLSDEDITNKRDPQLDAALAELK